MNAQVLQNLPPCSETGRYFIYSPILNKTFCIEPIGDHPDNLRSQWGDVNQATGKIEGSYGDKHKGSIKMKESIIKTENGFKDNGKFLGVGVSPGGYIKMLEQEHMRLQSKNE